MQYRIVCQSFETLKYNSTGPRQSFFREKEVAPGETQALTRTMYVHVLTHTNNLNFKLHCMEFRFDGRDRVVGLMQEGTDVTDVANDLYAVAGNEGEGKWVWSIDLSIFMYIVHVHACI